MILGGFLIYFGGVIVAYALSGLMDHLTNNNTSNLIIIGSWVTVLLALIALVIFGIKSLPSARSIFERKSKINKDQIEYDERKELYKQFNHDDTDYGIDIPSLTDSVLKRTEQRASELADTTTWSTFSMSKLEWEKYIKWRAEQTKLKKDPGELYHYTFCFTPDGIGAGIVVKCSNGNQIDVTDYESY